MKDINIKSSKTVVLEYFDTLFNPEFFDYDRMELLLGEGFEQHSDGRIRTREVILKHFEGHKKLKQTSTVKFIAIIENKENVFAHYEIIKPKAKGGETKWQVLAKFIVHNNQITLSDQLSEIIDSKEENMM